MKSVSEGRKQQINPELAEKFREKFVLDMAAVAGIVCTNIGDRLGLYKAMATMGPVTAAQLAEATSTQERYIKEWLINQAAGDYVKYDTASERFVLPAEHAAVLVDETSEYYSIGEVPTWMAFIRSEPRIAKCFKTGEGMLWSEHERDVFDGTERTFGPAYRSLLIPTWIPSIIGLDEKLKSGIKVADVGCGYGTSTMVMAKQYSRSKFWGFDNHAHSIEVANSRANKEGLADRLTFATCEASKFPNEGYGLIAFFDCLHDMGDPIAALKRAGETLAPDGVLMIVEPMGGRTIEENFNPVGRALSGASVMCCLPNAVASGQHSLGTIASDEALKQVAAAGGFKHFKRVAETPFNRVFEARP